ncbi:transcription termination factor, RNA polymerase II [Parelaphostrongylus tenuis]|uniref:Transcription termination factor, RNA polymerase II n=1 Tax=Parelaphostrongylus tenuis TaxID=148309 RepID=A0AAD5RBG6_PARTN|nr:transcription termination factor, RNA polymerase II [Parelaphostrongylus tenuis]
MGFVFVDKAVNVEAFQSIGADDQLTAEEQEELANITIDSIVDTATFDDLNFILEENTRVLSVVVSQWTSFLKILEKHIVKPLLHAQCSTIGDDVHPLERQDRVKRFNEDEEGTNVMLISISAGGVGLNLTGGNHSVLMDLHWNPAIKLQACDRIHRMGQTREVHVHKLHTGSCLDINLHLR